MEPPVMCSNVDLMQKDLVLGLPCFENALARENVNLEECVSSLYEHELSCFGIGSIYLNSLNDKPTLGNVFRRLIICLSEYKKRLLDGDETIQKLSKELSDARASEKRLRDERDGVLREIKGITEKERHTAEKLKKMELAFTKEKNEVNKLTRELKNLSAHCQSVNKGKERHREEAFDKLQSLLNDKSHNNPPGIKMLNVLSRKDGSRGAWNTGATTKKLKDDLIASAMASYMERITHFCNENILLKATLECLLQDLNTLSEDNQSTRPMCEDECYDEAEGGGFNRFVKVTLHCQQHFDANNQRKLLNVFHNRLETVRESLNQHKDEDATILQMDVDIKDQLKNELASLKEKLEHQHGDVDVKDQLKNELASLREKLEHQQEIIHNQQKLLDAAIYLDSGDNPYLKDGFILEDKEKFQRERDFFMEQRSNFEKERRAFTEAAMRLAREKKEFEEQRYNILKLHNIPLETPPQKHKIVRHQAEHEFSKSLPSTPELYQILGLSPVE